MLYLIRGLPGSGKSTLAKKLAHGLNAIKAWSCLHFEADDYFYDEEGIYRFDARSLPLAHKSCQDNTFRYLAEGKSVVVANTFTRIWELQPYLDMAKGFGVPVTVITCEGDYGSTHDVPDHAMRMMKARWEPYEPMPEYELGMPL